MGGGRSDDGPSSKFLIILGVAKFASEAIRRYVTAKTALMRPGGAVSLHFYRAPTPESDPFVIEIVDLNNLHVD